MIRARGWCRRLSRPGYWTCLVASIALLALVAPGSAFAADFPFGWSASATSGPVHQVDVDQYCNPADSQERPDEPVRAFRVQIDNDPETYRVQMNYPNEPFNRRLVGPSLEGAIRENAAAQPDTEERPCPVAGVELGNKLTVFYGKNGVPGSNSSYCPQDFDDHEWLVSPYYIPGTGPNSGTIYSLNHHEFHGTSGSGSGYPLSVCGLTGFPNGFCTTTFENCWMGAITFSESTDGISRCPYLSHPAAPDTRLTKAGTLTPNSLGLCYAHRDAAIPPSESSQLVATIPDRYRADWGPRFGYVEHSNILKGESGSQAGYYYLAAVVRGPADSPQPTGVCVLRTSTIETPNSWMAWDGESFSARPASGYSDPTDPSDQVCQPVAPVMQPFSLTFNRYLGKYMLLGHAARPNPQGPSDWAVYFSLSDDLINWSERQMLMQAPAINDQVFCDLPTVSYPVLLDPTDPAASAVGAANRNFDHPGRTSNLYFRINPTTGTCARGVGRLARIPIKFEQKRAILTNPATLGGNDGFDSTNFSGTGSGFAGSATLTDYDDSTDVENAYAVAQTGNPGAPAWAFGRINTKGVSKGDDFWYGSAFYLPNNFQDNGRVDLLRWESSTGGYFGGIQMNTSDTFALVRSTSTSGSLLGNTFDLPLGRWFWLEVHQKVSDVSGEAINEVYLDGSLINASTVANRYNADTSPITRVKYGIAYSGAPVSTSVLIDRASLTSGPLGAVGAPATPVGLRNDSGQVWWNPVAGTGITYNVYLRVNGNWTSFSPVGGQSDTIFDCVPGYQEVRVTSMRNGVESLPSAPQSLC